MDIGLDILYYLNWNNGRWKEGTGPSEEDYELGKAQGYLFDSVPSYTHDETLQRIRSVTAQIDPKDVSNAFLYSLSTRQLHYRSALGSYYCAISIPDHTQTDTYTCYFCDWWPVEDPDQLNSMNFERYKFGGIGHTRPQFALFDLEQFLLLPKVTPTDDDFAILKSILDTINDLPKSKKVGAYRELITKKKLFRSNKVEVELLLNILGICGVLSSENAPCYCEHFADVWHRAPIEHKNDYEYPVNRWYVSDGVNEKRFEKVFGIKYSDM